MNERRSNLGLLLGLLASLVLHGSLILPFLVQALTSENVASTMQARFQPRTVEERRHEETPPPELGIDADTPSSLTWIGYEEYQEHLARLAEFDQAAFTEEPQPAGGSPTPEPSPPVELAMNDITPEPITETQTSPEPTEDEPIEDEPAEEEPVEEADEVTETPAPAEKPTPVQVAFDEQALTPLTVLLNRLLIPATDEATDAPASKPAEPPPAPPKPQPPAPQPQPAPAPSESPQPGDAPSEKPQPGDRAPKESDAFSRIEVELDDIKLGKPIARPGLELLPRRPRFTTLQEVTAGGCNPLVEVSFDHEGFPVYPARILSSKCDPRILKAIESSLYRWRASGKAVRDLSEGQTLTVEIQIVIR